MNPIKVVLVDDHRVVSRGVQKFLESFPDITVIGVAASGEELLGSLEQWSPDVVVMDLLMPGGMDGVEATRRVRECSPKAHVVALTASIDEARMIGVLRAGAIGYVRKDAEPEILLAAVRAAAAGKSLIDPSAAGDALRNLSGESSREEELTGRETEVLRHLARGLTNREIGEALFISEETVKTHVGSILGKLGLAHRTQAVIYAIKRNLVPLDEL